MPRSGEELPRGLVLSGQNGLYQVETEEGVLRCRAGSGIRKDGYKLLAGDRVSVESHGDGTGFIRGIGERVNRLVRPPVANVDLLVLVVAVASPAPSLFVLDELTVLAEKQNIPLAFALTKCELGGAEEFEAVYRKTPYPIFRISERGAIGADALFDRLRGKTSVFCGASGVGKSTLLNSLFPGLNAETGELSAKLRRGRNTTRTTSLHPLGGGTYLADTPGFTMLDPEKCTLLRPEELPDLFPEFRPYLGYCRYSHCTHLCEDGCRILQAVSDGEVARERQESYRKLYRTCKALPPKLRFQRETKEV